MWWQPILDALPSIVNGSLIGALILMIARGQLWTRAAVDRAVKSLEHERDQAVTDRNWWRDAYMEASRTASGYADAAVRAAVPAARAANKTMQSLTDLTGGDQNERPPAQ